MPGAVLGMEGSTDGPSLSLSLVPAPSRLATEGPLGQRADSVAALSIPYVGRSSSVPVGDKQAEVLGLLLWP